MFSRRGLFGLTVGGAAAAVTARLAPIAWLEPPVQHVYLSLQDIVTTTLRARSGELAENMMRSNALLRKLMKV